MTRLHYSTFFVLRATIYKLNIDMNIPGKEGKASLFAEDASTKNTLSPSIELRVETGIK